MQIAMSESEQKGGFSMVLFHCLFHDNGSFTSFMHDFDVDSYHALPNLYAVCVANKSPGKKKITAGFFIKTNYSDEDVDFIGTLNNVVSSIPEIARLVSANTSFLPGRIKLTGAPISESEMIRAITSQALKHGVGGSA